MEFNTQNRGISNINQNNRIAFYYSQSDRHIQRSHMFGVLITLIFREWMRQTIDIFREIEYRKLHRKAHKNSETNIFDALRVALDYPQGSSQSFENFGPIHLNLSDKRQLPPLNQFGTIIAQRMLISLSGLCITEMGSFTQSPEQAQIEGPK
ncbi:MAG: hypothetical protein VW226_10455 [Rhodospirillaceae bacterium]